MTGPFAEWQRRRRWTVDPDAAADVLNAVDDLLVAYSNGPDEMAPLLNDLHRLLHPEQYPPTTDERNHQ